MCFMTLLISSHDLLLLFCFNFIYNELNLLLFFCYSNNALKASLNQNA